VTLRRRRRGVPIADTVIRDPDQSTVMDARGAVRSVQAADVTLPAERLEAVWDTAHLERLARTYWRYLSRVSLGLFRVVYTPEERVVVLVCRPFVLLRFYAPEYTVDARRGVVRWRIRDGLLVARRGKGGDGYLEIDVRRLEDPAPGRARVHVEIAIASFYPAIAVWFARWFYANTQSRIHVLVTHGFLRSLATLELEESSVGYFAVQDHDEPGATAEPGSELPSPQSGEQPAGAETGDDAPAPGHRGLVGAGWVVFALLLLTVGLVVRARRR
jgi:hypothetical protein